MTEVERAAEVRQALQSMLDSEGFATAPKLQRFLRFVVERALEGRENEIKESVIGLEVYQKSAGYDPRLDATVRVEASKIRHRLEQYYQTEEGRRMPVQISMPKGSYVPRFEFFAPPAVSPPAEGAIEPVPVPVAPLPETGRRSGLTLLAVLVIGLALGWVVARLAQSRFEVGPTAQIIPLSDFTTYSADPAISPDGDFVVYASDRSGDGIMNLWRQRIDGGVPLQVTALQNTARAPSVSRDGRRVVFRLEAQGGVLATSPIEGGGITIIEHGRLGRDPRYSPADSRIAYWVAQDEQTLDRGAVYLLDSVDAGSEPARLFGAFAHAAQPVWSSSGTHVIALGTWQSQVPEREYDAWTLGLADGRPHKSGLLPLLARLGYYRSMTERSKVRIGDWRDGWLYFSAPAGQGENLFRIRLREEGEVSGSPEAVTTGAGSNNGVRVGPKGRIVFVNSLVSYGLHSALPGAPDAGRDRIRRLTSELGLNMRASADRTGRWAGWERPGGRDSTTQLWLADLESGTGREIGVGTVPTRSHVLVSPDARRVAYMVLEGTSQAIYIEPAAGGEPPRCVCDDCGAPTDWDGAGTHILYTTGGRPNGIGLLEVDAQRNTTLIDHPSYGLHGARFLVNSDGDGWMALYADTGPRTRQIFAAPVKKFHPADYHAWIPVTDGAHWDLSPAWSPDGRSIYFVSRRDGHRCIWVQALDPLSKRPSGSPVALYHFHSQRQTLMESVTYRGADALRVAGDRLLFSLDNTASSLWLKDDGGPQGLH